MCILIYSYRLYTDLSLTRAYTLQIFDANMQTPCINGTIKPSSLRCSRLHDAPLPTNFLISLGSCTTSCTLRPTSISASIAIYTRHLQPTYNAADVF